LPNIKPDNVHLVFVDECHNIGDCVAAQDLMKFCWARKFGFSATPVRNDGSAIVMESLLGPTILKMTYEEAVDAKMVTPMSYTMLPCPKAPNPAYNPALPDVMKRKWSYWRNSYRNKVLQRFVQELSQVYKGQILIMVGEQVARRILIARTSCAAA
jgi:superfamily II DNA or RNA helicase